MGSPYDDPQPRGFPIVLATLRITIAVQCWGAAAAWLHESRDGGLVDLLQQFLDIPEPAARLWMTRGAWALAAAGTVTLVRPITLVLLLITVWFGLVSYAGTRLHGELLEPIEHAVRFLCPVALLLLDFWPPRIDFSLGRANIAVFLLRLGSALTFAGHGLVALMQSREGGPFVDLITLSFANVFGMQVSEEQARIALGVIGGVDLGCALALMTARSRSIAACMAVWGLLTAVSRVLAHGPDWYHQTLLRIANCGAPAVLLIYWLRAVKGQPPVTIPGDQ